MFGTVSVSKLPIFKCPSHCWDTKGIIDVLNLPICQCDSKQWYFGGTLLLLCERGGPAAKEKGDREGKEHRKQMGKVWRVSKCVWLSTSSLSLLCAFF